MICDLFRFSFGFVSQITVSRQKHKFDVAKDLTVFFNAAAFTVHAMNTDYHESTLRVGTIS